MKSNTKTILIIAAIVIVAVGGWWIFGRGGLQPVGSGFGTPTAPVSTPSGILSQGYSSETYRFSFSYPASHSLNEFAAPDGEGDVIVVSDPKTGGGMQIYITPFDEPADNLTIERVKSSLPDLAISDARPIQVGGSGKGVGFRDGSASDAKIQRWFVAGGQLYQVTAPAGFAETLDGIISTWKFQ